MTKEQKAWDSFVVRQGGSFLQSWEWGEFQNDFRRKVYRLKDKKHNWQVQLFKYTLPFGLCYFYVPRGPVLLRKNRKESKHPEYFREAISKIIKLAEKEEAIFLKLEPEGLGVEFMNILGRMRFSFSQKSIQPIETIILDVACSEKDLQENFKPKTRYNIRLAIKKNVKVRKAEDDEDLEEFQRIIEGTAGRQEFRIHSKNYYKKMLKRGVVDLFLAEYPVSRLGHQDIPRVPKIVAAALVNFFGKRVTYLHGASDYEYRSVMAPHLLHWKIIREAKKRRFKEYDFWGVDDKRWPGVTRFKEAWGGARVKAGSTWDLALRPGWYSLYKFISSTKRNF
jgi:lipid II:glycine glycyltransferase (peptidoglycan interpeptide bridge formation enzyme)